MEMKIDKQLQDNCNVNIGCISYNTNVSKTNSELWEYINNEVINNVVDTNNLISIETGYSVGSYDLEKVQGEINFRIGKQGEQYQGIGKEMINIENLPVFADDIGAYGSPTSDSTRTMITDKSKEILTVLISFNGKTGLEESIELAKKYLKLYANAENIKSVII